MDPTADTEPIETTQQRMRWLAHLQFTHEQVEEELTWGSINVAKIRGEKFDELMRTTGIPHSLRYVASCVS